MFPFGATDGRRHRTSCTFAAFCCIMSWNTPSIVAVGTVAFDSIKTPFGERERIVGGAGTYILSLIHI